MLEPGYWDALEEEFSEADLPFDQATVWRAAVVVL